MRLIVITLLVLVAAGLLGLLRPAAPRTGDDVLRVMAPSWMFGKYALDDARKRFEADHPGVRVELIKAPVNWEQRLLIAMLAGRIEADLIIGPNEADASIWAIRDLLEPWDDDVARYPALSPDRFNPTSFNAARFANHQYGLPICSEFIAIGVNKRLAAEAGLLDADGNMIPARTWEEVFDYARRMTRDLDGDGKTDIVGLSINWSYGNAILFGTIHAADGNLPSIPIEQTPVDHPAVRELLQRTRDGAAEGIVSLGSLTDVNQPRNDMKAGRLAMQLSWASHSVECEQTLGDGAIVLMPLPGSNAGGTLASTMQIVVPAGASERAKSLARQFTREQLLDPWFTAWSYEHYRKLPPLNAAVEQFNSHQLRLQADWLARSAPWPSCVDRSQMTEALHAAQQRYLTGQIDLDAFARSIRAELIRLDLRDLRRVADERSDR